MIRTTLCAIVALIALPAAAQHAHQGSDGPLETGQSAFAAISEIVQILSDDPGTDWTKVNIQALRDHLVDMELVTTQATVNTQTEGRIVEFRVTGEGIVADAVARMATAHSPMLETATGWTVTAQPSTGGSDHAHRGSNRTGACPRPWSRVLRRYDHRCAPSGAPHTDGLR